MEFKIILGVAPPRQLGPVDLRDICYIFHQKCVEVELCETPGCRHVRDLDAQTCQSADDHIGDVSDHFEKDIIVEISRRARLSRCGTYRYTLEREWGGTKTVVVIGLNPSTADAQTDDPTVRRCVGFASDWGYDRLIIVNLFAYRSTDPRKLADVTDPVGPSNDRIIRESIDVADLVVAAWGARGGLMERDAKVRQMLDDAYCIGVTANGMPRHPLYLPKSAKPVPLG